MKLKFINQDFYVCCVSLFNEDLGWIPQGESRVIIWLFELFIDLRQIK